MKLKALVLLILVNATFLYFSSAVEKKGEKKFYDPVIKTVEGWTIEYDPQLLSKENKKFGEEATKALANHLQRIKYILPKEKVTALQKLPIRIDLQHELGNMQYHPGKGWLIDHGYDPRLEKRVHIPRAKSLLDRHTWAKHPYVILHELAHAYHDQVLSFDHREIIDAYNSSEKKGLYERVLLYRGGKTRHYARTNHKEFFAEMTESYLGVNDFYPFVRGELKEHDPLTYALMQKIWGKI
jgi:dipeptidyl-peptidase-4